MADKDKPDQTRIMPKQEGDAPRGAAKTDDMMTAVRQVVVARLAIIDGPGKGASFNIYNGSNSIGRDPSNNVVPLDFGDTAIHRHEHAYVAHSKGAFEIHDNGKPNPLSVNGKTLIGKQALHLNDLILIGATTLRLEKA